MKRINYESSGLLLVPLWSWIACTGGIKFIDDPFRSLEIFTRVNFCNGDTKALTTDVWKFEEGCSLGVELKTTELETTRRQILDSLGHNIGWLSFDVEDRNEFCGERVVIVGKISKGDKAGDEDFHILLVK